MSKSYLDPTRYPVNSDAARLQAIVAVAFVAVPTILLTWGACVWQDRHIHAAYDFHKKATP